MINYSHPNYICFTQANFESFAQIDDALLYYLSKINFLTHSVKCCKHNKKYLNT